MGNGRSEVAKLHGGLVDKNSAVDMPVAFGKDLKGLQTLPLCVCSRHWMVWFLWLFFLLLENGQTPPGCVCGHRHTCACGDCGLEVAQIFSRSCGDFHAASFKSFCNLSHCESPCFNADHMRSVSRVLG